MAYQAVPATEKQIYRLNKLLNDKGYIAITNITTLTKLEASKIIDFLLNGNGEYEEFRKFIRIKGPKIPNLVGDYLYEDF